MKKISKNLILSLMIILATTFILPLFNTSNAATATISKSILAYLEACNNGDDDINGIFETDKITIELEDGDSYKNYTSSNTKVISISGSSSTVTFNCLKAGTVTITDSNGFSVVVTVQPLRLDLTTLSMKKGETYQMNLIWAYEPTSIKWSSSNKSIATVNSDGLITAKKNGTATITAKYNGKSYKCKVTVENTKISKTKLTLIKGKTSTLKITGTVNSVLDGIYPYTVKWSSSNTSVATVSSTGKITAKKKGTATITAKVNGKSYKCKVTVETPSLNYTSKTLKKNHYITLKLNGNTQSITWSTSNKSIATVNSKGKVTAKKKGTCYIYAKVSGVTYKCKITVTN